MAMLLSFSALQAQIMPCTGIAAQNTAAAFPVYDPHNADVIVNCRMLQTDSNGGTIKAIAYGKNAENYALPTPTAPEAHVYVEDWNGNKLTINLPANAQRPDVALADGPTALYPPQPGENPMYRLVVTYQIGYDAYFQEYLITDCGTPMIAAGLTNTQQLNTVAPGYSYIYCDTFYGMPHISTWVDTKLTNAANGFPYVHRFSIVFSAGNIHPGGVPPGYIVIFPIPPSSYILADTLYSYEEDLDVPPPPGTLLLPNNWGPNACQPDVACYHDLITDEDHIQVAYNSAGYPRDLRYLDINAATYPSQYIQTNTATILDDTVSFPPRIECMSWYNPSASPYQAKFEVTDVRNIYTGCSSGSSRFAVQACGYNNLSPARTWLSPAHPCDNIKSPCVAGGVGLSYGSAQLGNIQYTTGYFPWAGNSIYTRSINPVTGGVDPRTWEVNCGSIGYHWDVSRSFHISNCGNTGYDLLSAWHDGQDIVYKNTINTMLFRMIPQAVTGLTGSGVIRISPNPAREYLQISGATDGQYFIKDMLGRSCARGKINATGQIDLRSCSPGVYQLQIQNAAGQTMTSRFSKL